MYVQVDLFLHAYMKEVYIVAHCRRPPRLAFIEVEIVVRLVGWLATMYMHGKVTMAKDRDESVREYALSVSMRLSVLCRTREFAYSFLDLRWCKSKCEPIALETR